MLAPLRALHLGGCRLALGCRLTCPYPTPRSLPVPYLTLLCPCPPPPILCPYPAPPSPPPPLAQLKGAAAGAMAIAYQAAHFVGLAAATLLVYLMYGTIGVD